MASLRDDEKRASIGYGPRWVALVGRFRCRQGTRARHPKRHSADAGGHPKREIERADAGWKGHRSETRLTIKSPLTPTLSPRGEGGPTLGIRSATARMLVGIRSAK